MEINDLVPSELPGEGGTPEWIAESIPLWKELARIKELEAQLKELSAQKEAAVLALQEQCKHPKDLANVCKDLHAKLGWDEDEEVPKKKKVTKKKKKKA
jgi:hypothetical protein